MKKYICEQCGKIHDGSYGSGRFCSSGCMHAHNFKVRNFQDIWKCPHCGFTASVRADLVIHRKEKHPEFCSKSHAAWNRGLTKDTSEQVKKYGEYLKNRYMNKELTPVFSGRKHSEKTRKLLSEKQKSYLKANPDKHPWKRNSKFISIPCERLKDMLRGYGIYFEEEFTDPGWIHNYSIDIAFSEKKLGIEVNGNQHYDGEELAGYYRKRNEYLESEGWTMMNIRCTEAVKEETVEKIMKILN